MLAHAQFAYDELSLARESLNSKKSSLYRGKRGRIHHSSQRDPGEERNTEEMSLETKEIHHKRGRRVWVSELKG